MNDFISEHTCRPYVGVKRILIVASCRQEGEEYRKTLTKHEQKSARYVSEPRDVYGVKADECHMVGRYYENIEWSWICDVLRAQGIDCKEVGAWR